MGSVSQAAKKLLVGQPTLSAQLKQFEETLGVQLFDRQHKKLILTEQGRVALEYAKNIFKMGSEMYEVLHDRLVPAKPNLSIGALDSIPKLIVLKLVKAALKISKCQITLLEGRPDELLRELSAHRIDLLITNFVPSSFGVKGLLHRAITNESISIYGTQKYKYLKKDFPKSISKIPIILPTYDSKLRYDIDHWSKLYSVDLDILAETQDIALRKLMAINSLGLLPAASHTVITQVKAGELVEIGELKGITEEIRLMAAQRKIENPIAKQLMKTFSV